MEEKTGKADLLMEGGSSGRSSEKTKESKENAELDDTPIESEDGEEELEENNSMIEHSFEEQKVQVEQSERELEGIINNN